MAFSNPTNNPMRDDMGRYRTYSLFLEYAVENYDPIWTLKDTAYEHEGILYPSLKAIYFGYHHVPGLEYEFATETFGSWDHWVKLNSSGLKGIFAEWREELEIRNKALAIRMLIKTSEIGGAAGANAAKYLAESGYASKRGRPSNADVERERKIQAGVEKELESDIERMGLKVVSK